jgi:hypothetical protein
MNENLIETKVRTHKNQVKELKKLESELVRMIAETNNDVLIDKFLDWQNQRIRCNETYVAALKVMADS